jgi:hypothetical protein
LSYLEGSSDPLASGDQTIVELIVRTPAEAKGGTSGLDTSKAISTLDNSVSASVSVTTTIWHQILASGEKVI